MLTCLELSTDCKIARFYEALVWYSKLASVFGFIIRSSVLHVFNHPVKMSYVSLRVQPYSQ